MGLRDRFLRKPESSVVATKGDALSIESTLYSSPKAETASIGTAKELCTLTENPWLKLMVPEYRNPFSEQNFDWSKDASASAEPVKYRPLSSADAEIRLLTIEPDRNGSPIRCKLEQVSLFDSPVYHALSYTWGAPDKTKPIIVNGSRFEATVNLLAALQIMRANGHLTVWADAVCINQNDREERSQQILRMRSIYARAAQVVVWMGPESSDSNLAMKLLSVLSKPEASLNNEASEVNYRAAVKERLTSAQPGAFAEAWQAFDRLFERQYWERVWIIQELVVSKNITLYCGDQSITWKDLETAFWGKSDVETFGLPQNFTEAPRKTDQMFDFWSWRKYMVSADARPLLKAMVDSRKCKATDPRDHVYSLLGLASDGPSLVPVPSYKQSVSQTFTELTIAMIEASKNLDIICLQGREITKLEGKPSWVPDWSSLDIERPWQIRIVLDTDPITPDPLVATFNFCGETYKTSIENNILTVSGRLWGIIDSLSTSFDGVDPHGSIVQAEKDPACAYRTTEDTAGALTNVFTMPCGGQRQLPTQWMFPQLQSPVGERLMSEHYPFLQKWLNANNEYQIFGTSIKDWTTSELTPSFAERLSNIIPGKSARRAAKEEKVLYEELTEYMGAIEPVLKGGMRLATTTRGHIALVHPLAQKGDHIALLEDMKTVIVLRPCKDEEFTPEEVANREAMKQDKKEERYMQGQTIITNFSGGYRVIGEAYGQSALVSMNGKVPVYDKMTDCPFLTFFIH